MEKYGFYIYDGPWVAGGKLEITTTTTCKQAVSRKDLMDYAEKMTDYAINSKGKLPIPGAVPVTVTVGASGKKIKKVWEELKNRRSNYGYLGGRRCCKWRNFYPK